MMSSIKQWTIRHNLKAVKQNTTFKHRQVKTFQDTSDSTAYSIAMSIKKRGLRATYFWDHTYDKLMPGLAPKLAQALQQDVTTVLKTLVVKRGTIE